jgi:hypothetical protein
MSKALRDGYSLLLIDLDRKGGGFSRAGFPREWDEDVTQIDFEILVAGVRDDLADEHQGAILSFPTTYRLSPEQLDVASRLGISTIVLWGTFDRCMEARRKREEGRGKTFHPGRYRRKNEETFADYASPDYDEFRVEAFLHDGSRPSYEALLKVVAARLADQRIELTATA